MSDRRENRTFRSERRDIQFVFWRKCVDSSVFSDRAITIIKPFERWWNIEKQFKNVVSQADPHGHVTVRFEKKTFKGSVVRLDAKARKKTYRLWFPQVLATELKRVFVMSYFRSIEGSSSRYHDANNRVSVYDELPFSEFMDIEYDEKQRTFHLTARYVQPALFPELFDRIRTLGAPSLSEAKSDARGRIVKSDWHPKSHINTMPERRNVIYYLRDNDAKAIYVGEASELKARLRGRRSEIPGWTHFRYDVLPNELAPFRIEIERMMISVFAQMFPVSDDASSEQLVSTYRLTNRKISR